MHYFILTTLLFYFLIYLFCIYAFAKDNFVLLRKNINTEQLFNLAFIVVLAGILFARIFFVFFHFKHDYFNPLVFFLIPYFPGLSAAGGLLVASVFLILYTYRSKIPTLYLLDIFSLSFLCTMPFVFLVTFFSEKHIVFVLPFLFLDWVAAAILISQFQKSKLTDGSVGYLSLIASSILLYAVEVINKGWFAPDDLFLLIIFGACCFFLFRAEKWHRKLKFNVKLPKIKRGEKWRQIR